jgi:hypothetical protein
MTFGRLFTITVGILEWMIAIAAVLGTIALIGWILKMILTKDKPDERSECKPDAKRKRDSAQPERRAQRLKDELH